MRTVEEIKADINNHIKTSPNDIAYCLQDCSMCTEEMKSWCGMLSFENELVCSLAYGIPFDRLAALYNAEREERNVIIPCKRGDVCYEVDPGHGIVTHTVTGYYAAEREIEYSDGIHVINGINISTNAIDDDGLSWPDHYNGEEWDFRIRTREEAEAQLSEIHPKREGDNNE